jgi:serine/threonine-protein kinase
MIRLLTLGSVDLRSSDGRVIRSVLAQPRRLALLTYLTLKEPGAFHQRNALLPVFWPESDESRARNALRNALHFLRAELGVGTIISRGDDELGVHPDALWCDAIAFESAVRQQRFDEAMQYWRGPLLDGFLPTGIHDFADWLDGKRRALDWLAADAARGLHEQAAAASDPAGAIAAARRWVEIAPHDEAAIRALTTRLASAGHVAQARDAFEGWTARFEREIGAPLQPGTTALATALASGTIVSGYTPVTPLGIQPPGSSLIEPRHESPGAASATDAKAADVARSRPRTRRFVLGIAAAMTVAAAIAGAAIWRGRSQADAPRFAALAVLPFSYSGAAQYDYLREALVDLLSTRMDGSSGLRTVDPRSVLAHAGRAAPRDVPVDPARAREIAGSFDAPYYVTGSVVEVNDRISLNAALYSTSSNGSALARVSLAGGVSELFQLADSITTVLARAAATARRVEAAVLRDSAAGTRSLDALRAFIDGEIAFNQARYGQAAAAYRRATEYDPGFARAYFRLSIADSWVGGLAPVRQPLEDAARHQERLSPDDRVLLQAWTDHIHARPRSADSLYTAYIANHPDNAEALFQLGEVRFHWGSGFGTPAADAASMFHRVLALLPDHAASLVHLIRLAGRTGDTAQVATLVKQLVALGPREEAHVEAQTIMAASGATPDTALLAAIFRGVSPTGMVELHNGLPTLAASVPDPGALIGLASRVTAALPADSTLRGNYTASGFLEAAAGRFDAAAAATRTFPPRFAVRGVEFRALFAALPFAGAAPSLVAAMRDSLRRLPTTRADRAREITPLTDGVVFAPRKALLDGLLSLRLGDRAALARVLEQLDGTDTTGLGRFAVEYARLLRARVLLDDGNARAALAALGEPAVEASRAYPELTSYGRALERLTRAEALARLGRDDEALRWLDGFPDNDGYDVIFVAPARLAAAEIESRRGNADKAMQYLRQAELAWRHGDAEPRAMLDRARAIIPAGGGSSP